MAHWLSLGDMVRVHAGKSPDAPCLLDASRHYSFAETDERCCRLATGLVRLGLAKGDRIAVLLENCIEFVELYVAAAKAGLVIVPVNFRLVGPEIVDIVEHAGATAFVAHDELCSTVDEVRSRLGRIPFERCIVVGEPREGWMAYEHVLATGEPHEPEVRVRPSDTWMLLYTSGTTGRPKGVLRSHESYVAFYLINAVDFGFRPEHRVLNIMPLCHVNTTFFTFTFTYIGGSAYIHPARGFDARELLDVISRCRPTFISLIPTHYALMLAIPEEERARWDVSSVGKLLCSSAPARIEHKRAIMRWFAGVELYEAYGSTEAGIVTTLFPDEQLTKPSSIGRESQATDRVLLLDEDRKPVLQGQVGELYSRGPMLFDGYLHDPERTASAHAGEHFSAGDMAYQDEDGYLFLVDRKHNMIISGGEHVYPSEVENVLACHPAILDAAVIAVPDPKWGEAVCAVVIPKETGGLSEEHVLAHCRARLAAYKRPKSVLFITADEMPRTATGKILHRVLRERYGKA